MVAIHLTFDDGPHETFTPAVLEVLARHGAKATFFQEGRFVERHPGLTRQVAREGHAIGNHAWNHPDLADEDRRRVREELASTSDAIERVLGTRPTLFRPPFGSPFISNPDHEKAPMIRAAAGDLGMTTILWDVSPHDYEKPKPGPDAIVKRVVDDPQVVAGKERLVVLLHDGVCADEADNVAALDVILGELSGRGFTFAAIP